MLYLTLCSVFQDTQYLPVISSMSPRFFHVFSFHQAAGSYCYSGPIPETQVIRYVADRTGVLLAANLPLVWIFSARNDPLLWITGWSYSTYSHFHRWVARITVAEIFVHSVVYTRFFTFNGTANYYEEWAEPYFYCGVIVSFCSLLN